MRLTCPDSACGSPASSAPAHHHDELKARDGTVTLILLATSLAAMPSRRCAFVEGLGRQIRGGESGGKRERERERREGGDRGMILGGEGGLT